MTMISDNSHTGLERRVQMAHEWREKMAAPVVSDEVQAAFQDWLNADTRNEHAYDRAVTIWAAYDQLAVSDIADDLLAPTLRERWYTAKTALVDCVDSRKMTRVIPTAAMIGVMVMIAVTLIGRGHSPSPLSPAEVNVYTTDTAQTTTVALADGSKATLGPKTTIETSISPEYREVVLKNGAALFNVVHDPARTFSVNAGDVTAIVLGTQFDVRSNGGITRVAVSEGSVRVASPVFVGGRSTSVSSTKTLSAGEQIAAYQAEGPGEIQPIAPEQVGAWTESLLVYHGATLAELLADIDRYYKQDIVVMADAEGLSASRITASFDTADIDRMLELIAMSFAVDVQRDASNNIIITAQPQRR
ncbi:MAG TPA: hypothetical protein DD979_14860 [Gammaproteobacteria bacterium]|nr:hypothetical protein [Gammaproteobacteria bacterium]